MSNATETLRKVYRNVRQGSPVDNQEMAAAYAALIGEGCDMVQIDKAFEPHAFLNLSAIQNGDGAMMILAARERGGWLAALRMASTLGWSEVWAAAMTAHFGPCGTHESRLGQDGRPTAETLAEFPEIARRMDEAAERFEGLLGWHIRNGSPTRWEYVLQAKRSA